MEEKLRSISKQIHWSLVLKAAVFALAWLWLPFWLFFFVALYLYFVPLFRTQKLAVLFFTLLLLCYLQAPGYFFAIVFAALFYATLLVKDLFVINRRSTYEFLILLLSFLLIRGFYLTFSGGVGGEALFAAFVLAGLLSVIIRSSITEADVVGAVPTKNVMRTFFWFAWVLLTQLLIAGLFLPLDFIYQSILVFLVAVLFVDLMPEHFSRGLTRTKILAAATTIFTLFVIVLGFARWGL